MKSPRSNNSSYHVFKLCIFVTAIIMIALSAVFVTLWFTLLKPKQPEITLHLTGLEDIQIRPFPLANVTLNLVITIDNKNNYGSFHFKNTKAYVNYRGNVVGEAPIGYNVVPTRGKINITSTADLMVSRMISNPLFFGDIISGVLNLTSTASFHGRVSLLKYLKKRAVILSTCDISFIVASRKVQSMCYTKLKL